MDHGIIGRKYPPISIDIVIFLISNTLCDWWSTSLVFMLIVTSFPTLFYCP